jgi:hypothetical protein
MKANFYINKREMKQDGKELKINSKIANQTIGSSLLNLQVSSQVTLPKMQNISQSNLLLGNPNYWSNPLNNPGLKFTDLKVDSKSLIMNQEPNSRIHEKIAELVQREQARKSLNSFKQQLPKKSDNQLNL